MKGRKNNFFDIIPNFGIIISLIIIATMLILSDTDYVNKVFRGKTTTEEETVVETYRVSENEVATSSKNQTTNSTKTDSTKQTTGSDGKKNNSIDTSKKEWIAYEQTSYSCKVGEVIDTMIRAGGSNPTAVRSFGSSNVNVAAIEVGTSSGLVTNCSDCRAVHITCKSEGTASLNAISTNGATTSVKVTVSAADKGWIKYDKESYSCNEGDVIDTMIRAGGSTKPVSVTSFKSTDSKIATVEEGTSSGLSTNCINCRAVHITCKKAGSVTLQATSSTGATTSSKVSVNGVDKAWIKFEKESYSCTAGEVFDTLITANAGINSFSSSDSNIAIIQDGYVSGAQVNCVNCRAVHVTCKKAGTVTLSATSSKGAKTTAKLKVAEANKGWIKYDKENYSCKTGEVIDTMIRTGGASTPSSIKSFGSSDSNIAIVEDGSSIGAYTNCIDCRAVHITCKKVGNVTLKASSSTGATTTSKVEVESASEEKQWIKYDKENYSCKAGEKVDALITSNTSIKSFGSSDSNIAIVEDGYSNGSQVKCINCRAVHITCKKAGNVTINATSAKGATTTSKVTVSATEEKQWIKYDKENYSCKAGEKVDALITSNTSIKSFGSSDSNIAIVEDGYVSGAQVKCVNCRAVHITCKKAGNVTINATSTKGATTTSKVKVEAASSKGWIKYDQDNYSCKAGEVIDTMIRAGGASQPSAIRSYESTDPSIASIESGTSTGLETNCIDCKAVHITCKKAGNVTLKASSSTGATTTSKVTVSATEEKQWIKYEKTSYACKEGEVVDTLITSNTSISTFGSSDLNIASVEDGYSNGAQVRCINCRAVHITCKKAGNVTIHAKSSKGATTTSSVSVSAPAPAWIKYEKENYSCKAGEVINTLITAGGVTGEGISSFGSSDNSIATVEAGYTDGSQVKCINCRAVHITCKKAGNVTVNAVSSTGAKTTSKVTVKAADKGWIKYDKESYTCKPGEVIDTKITAGGSTQPAGIAKYGSSDTSIATVEDGYANGTQIKCINCRAVHITCKKAGKVDVTASSTTGATTSSKVTVEAKTGDDWIKFEKTSYSCKVGGTFDTIVRVGGSSGNYAKHFRSSDSSIASMDVVDGGFVSGCTGCRKLHVTCKKAGTMTITATSSTGLTASTSVKVKKN